MKFDSSNFEESRRSEVHVEGNKFTVSQISQVVFHWMNLCRSHCGQLATHFENGVFPDTGLGTGGKTVTETTTKCRRKEKERERETSCDAHN